ncbi:hypothetical protein LDENG_00244230 [Lucifuga dentata]|nr:hypothetical protein LDENG_00244230 [Lucifuga dentata]
MEDEVSAEVTDWPHTRKAVADFRKLLLCAKCSNLMTEPVCLGTCEHMLCRSCLGPRAGDGCVLCHSPAWVKDIRVNKQLSNIIQSFCRLESQFTPIEEADSSLADIQTQQKSIIFKFNKPFRIWHSPRSHKIRCTVEKSSEVTILDSRSSGENVSAQCKDLSVFNFTSSQDSAESTSPQKCNIDKRKRKKRSTKNAANRKPLVHGARKVTGKQTKQNLKKKLEVSNQQWGITEEVDAVKENEEVCVGGARQSNKRVSFLLPAVSSDEPQPEAPQESVRVHSPDRSSISGSLSAASSSTFQPAQSKSSCPPKHESLSANDPKLHEDTAKLRDISPLRHSSKRSRVEATRDILETTPKRPRASPSRRRQSVGLKAPVSVSAPFLTSPRVDRSGKIPTEHQGDNPSFQATMEGKSPRTQSPSVGRLTPGSPAVTKRNHKGETLLHLAAIKGDVEAVNELLDQGANPNLKDNAGWTPLHEACNLGHQAVVEVLIMRGALLNTPGYENDSPLHDAVMNGHPAIAKLLLQHGAVQNVLNLHGKRPADYAVTSEMQEIFQEVSEGTQHANAALSSPANLSVASDSVTNKEKVVFLSTKLPVEKQTDLELVGQELGWTKAEMFSGSVTHVVVPEHMITTHSTLMAVLAGCWVVTFSWVKACQQAGKQVPESEHEAGEGPQRSRINKCNLLPPLFDGCYFYLQDPFKRPSKNAVIKLLREGGGSLLCRRPKPDSDVTQTLVSAAYHALPGSDQALFTHYIIYDPQGSYKPAAVRSGKNLSVSQEMVIFHCDAKIALIGRWEKAISRVDKIEARLTGMK